MVWPVLKTLWKAVPTRARPCRQSKARSWKLCTGQETRAAQGRLAAPRAGMSQLSSDLGAAAGGQRIWEALHVHPPGRCMLLAGLKAAGLPLRVQLRVECGLCHLHLSRVCAVSRYLVKTRILTRWVRAGAQEPAWLTSPGAATCPGPATPADRPWARVSSVMTSWPLST